MKSKMWILLSSLAFFIFCAGSGIGAAAEKEPINIGVIASLTGYLSDQAQNVVEGVELAVEEINASGGLLGRPIKIHSRDDEMKPPVGARRFEDLVKNQGIVMHSGVVFAPVSSSIQQTNKQLGDKGVVLFQAATNILETGSQEHAAQTLLCREFPGGLRPGRRGTHAEEFREEDHSFSTRTTQDGDGSSGMPLSRMPRRTGRRSSEPLPFLPGRPTFNPFSPRSWQRNRTMPPLLSTA